jgi:hypothetical protein
MLVRYLLGLFTSVVSKRFSLKLGYDTECESIIYANDTKPIDYTILLLLRDVN